MLQLLAGWALPVLGAEVGYQRLAGLAGRKLLRRLMPMKGLKERHGLDWVSWLVASGKQKMLLTLVYSPC